MSTNEPVSLTREELTALHLNPDCLFCSERLPDHPVDVRYKDDRVMRGARGHVSVYFGYYTAAQCLFRRLFSQRIQEKFEAAGGSFTKMFLTPDK